MTKKLLSNLIADLEEEAVLKRVQQRLAAGEDPMQIIEDSNEGMRRVGQRYEQGEYFVSGLIMSGEIFREVVELVQPHLVKHAEDQSSGRVMVGTVSGDIHDLGKNMAGMLLACHGFTVVDLGVDVPPEKFAAKAIEVQPDIVGLSGLIAASYETMRQTITTLRGEARKHGLSFPILIAGGRIDDQVRQYVGADFYVPDAMSGVRLCQSLMKAREGEHT